MKMFEDFTLTIAGEPVYTKAGVAIRNPATGEIVASAPCANADHVDRAVTAARSAQPGWWATPLEERQRLVRSLAEVARVHESDFARLLTLEQGKPLHASRGAFYEVRSIQTWFEAVANRAAPSECLLDTASRKVCVHREPLGVVAAIAPWNFPMTLAVWKIAPALVTGNTVVLKPSPHTPLTMLKFAECARALLPPGVLNVISGDDSLGPLLTAHPGVDKIAFTGSTPTGKAILCAAAKDMKRVTLEMGGNDPAIVFDDVDIEAITPKLFWGAFANSAQFCLAIKRLYVHDRIYDRLLESLIAFAKTVRMGNGLEQGVELGPIQNRMQYGRLACMLGGAKARRERIVLGGVLPEGPGNFVPVTLVDDPPEASPVVTEEAFGPILPLLRFTDDDDVIRRANDSPYGLGASIWTADSARAASVASRVQAGTIWVNTIHAMSPDYVFGGYKQSAFGRENGQEGLLEYTQTKTLITDDVAAGE